MKNHVFRLVVLAGLVSLGMEVGTLAAAPPRGYQARRAQAPSGRNGRVAGTNQNYVKQTQRNQRGRSQRGRRYGSRTTYFNYYFPTQSRTRYGSPVRSQGFLQGNQFGR